MNHITKNIFLLLSSSSLLMQGADQKLRRHPRTENFKNYCEFTLGAPTPIYFNLCGISFEADYSKEQIEELPIIQFFQTQKIERWELLKKDEIFDKYERLEKEKDSKEENEYLTEGKLHGFRLISELTMERIEYYSIFRKRKIEISAEKELRDDDKNKLLAQQKIKEQELLIQKEKTAQYDKQKETDNNRLKIIKTILLLLSLTSLFIIFTRSFLAPLFAFLAPRQKPQTIKNEGNWLIPLLLPPWIGKWLLHLFPQNKKSPQYINFSTPLAHYLDRTQKVIECWAEGNNVTPPHMILHGMPGVGKTLFASNIATLEGITFIHSGGASLSQLKKNQESGEVKKEILRLIALARRCEKAIIYIDEIDLLSTEDMRAILEEFPEVHAKKIMLILSTNTINKIPPALISRLVKIQFTPPDRNTLGKILLHYLQEVKKSSKLKVPQKASQISRLIDLMYEERAVPRRIKSTVREAENNVAMKQRKSLHEKDLLRAYLIVSGGMKTLEELQKQEKEAFQKAAEQARIEEIKKQQEAHKKTKMILVLCSLLLSVLLLYFIFLRRKR